MAIGNKIQNVRINMLLFLGLWILNAVLCLSTPNSKKSIEGTLVSDKVIIYQASHSVREDNCQEKIDFIFYLREEKIELRLTLNKDDKSSPIFYINDENEEEEYRTKQFGSKEDRTAVFKGVGSSFLVQCDERGSKYDTCVCKMSGTIFHKNIVYGILPNFIFDKIYSKREGNHQIHGYFHLVYDLSLSSNEGSFTFFNLPRFNENVSTLNKTLIHRSKRGLLYYIIEIGIVIDNSIYEFFANQMSKRFQKENVFLTYYLTQYYFYTLDLIDYVFQSLSTTKYGVAVTCSGIYLLNIHKPSPWANDSMEAEQSLTLFRNWLNNKTDTNLVTYDHVLFFTKHAIAFPNDNEKAFTWARGICSNMSTSVLFERFSIITGVIASKMIAQNIGLTENKCESRVQYVMSSELNFDNLQSPKINIFEFSNCTTAQFEMLIHKHRYLRFCFSKEATSIDNSITLFRLSDKFKPGLEYSPNEQCRHRFGLSSSADGCQKENFVQRNTLCRRLLCLYNSTCVGIYPLEGTSCGTKMWCYMSQCVYNLKAPHLLRNCWLGDKVQGILPGTYNMTCKDIPDGYDYFCYDPKVKEICCWTCFSLKSKIVRCEYGDRGDDCWRKECPFYNRTYQTHDCCHTCGHLSLGASSSVIRPNSRHRIIKLAAIAMSVIFTIKIAIFYFFFDSVIGKPP
ncbi:uncharacterized protein LOC106878282 [Octopus bimaculoides]|uniref:Peptidase M12B domain-containing protein n=1 Tax=Octopus bimaculoides TaxID=37653 RepID=A0A0L8G9L0_OCTBM|nr:uncharacterized protein LOC106878282 [Octopus bimaculoides]|eukprot:XP_014782945.1 PREDICTED: uncharacterized protein LOC106878282 [Octopus bimaculoides]